MILELERFERHAVDRIHILGDRVDRLLIVRQGNQLVWVLDAQNLQHAAMQLGQVVDVRRHLGHLNHGLVLHHALRHGGSVGIAHGNNVHVREVALLGFTATLLWLERILVWRVVSDDLGQQLQLLLERVVHTGLNSRHDFELALKQGQSRTDRGLARHIADLHVRSGREATALFNDIVQQRIKNLAGLFVRQR